MRALVAAGFDMAGLNQFGAPILEVLIEDLAFSPEAPKYEVVKEMLRLGADARQHNADGFGPLFAAV